MPLWVLRSFLSYFLSIKVDLEVLVYLKPSPSLLVPAGGVFTTSLKNKTIFTILFEICLYIYLLGTTTQASKGPYP